jgi:amidase
MEWNRMATGEDAMLVNHSVPTTDLPEARPTAPWQPIVASWVGATGWQIAHGVRRGDATAAQVVADHLDHARVADRILGALRHLRAGAAIAEAEQVDEQPDLLTLPLAGVPVVIHEDVALTGLPMGAVPDEVAPADHELVRRLRGAGAIVLGTSRGPGQSRSPWRTDRGSGTGAAAAVAAGIVPIAVDAGSVAAYGGLLGLQPSRPAPARRNAGADPTGLVRPVVVATNAADATLGLAVVSGREPAPLPAPPRLRVAVALRAAVPLARSRGGVRRSVIRVAGHIVARGHDAVLAVPPHRRRLAPADWRDRCVAFFAAGGFDALLLPAPQSRPAFVDPTAASWRDAGLPVLSLPSGVGGAGWRDAGLPGGVLLVGAAGTDLRLLALAGQIESAAPWPPHAPTWPRLSPRSWWTGPRR